MSMRWMARAAALGLLAGAAGCAPDAPADAGRELPRNVRVLALETGDITEYFEVAGPVVPVRAADLAAEEAGPVVALGAAKGAAVPAGGLIVAQERDLLRAELDAARAALAAREYDVDKIRQLHAAGKVSRIELLEAESRFAEARGRAEAARVRHGRAAIVAPFAGVLVDRQVELGELLVPGMPVARVIDPYVLKLEAFLTDAQVRWVHRGDPATVVLGETGGEAAGTVGFISPEADRQTGKFAVEIEIPDPELRLRSGVIGRARLPKHRTAGAVAVPRDAVLPGRAGPAVFVVEGDRARRRQVTLGPYQGLMVVVEAGLAPGERLVVRGQRDLRDGSLVAVTETAAAPDGSLPGDPAEVTAAGAATRVGGAARTGAEAVR
ncbi:MAG: efflux RND transporter periplasmic adaptor subunit [Candidatus Krumholzibacteriia bacterium]